jgi:RNA-directed DNA polymerase
VMTKSFMISKKSILEAWKRVKLAGGSGGIDGESLKEFEAKLKPNLYKIWNRMSSGCYLPPPIKAVEIPKKSGGVRVLGIPTVADRVAQMCVKMHLEPMLELVFHENSYGYRPRKSAHDAIEVTKKRCWKYKWVLEFDIKGMFDNIEHGLLMKALAHHCKDPWVLLYVKRWLCAPSLSQNGDEKSRIKGTPQGGVVSPLLANLFMHYAFDNWMQRNHPTLLFCRYADDGLIHFSSNQSALKFKSLLAKRLAECGLELHPEKTKVVYCGTSNSSSITSSRSFDFLGFTFRRRGARLPSGKLFTGFLPAISKSALKAVMAVVKKWRLHRKVDIEIEDISNIFKPQIQGWFNYYGRFYKSALSPLWRQINSYLVRWVQGKYKRFKKHKSQAAKWLGAVSRKQSKLFLHWNHGAYPSAE